jgi:hypothetical protein
MAPQGVRGGADAGVAAQGGLCLAGSVPHLPALRSADGGDDHPDDPGSSQFALMSCGGSFALSFQCW